MARVFNKIYINCLNICLKFYRKNNKKKDNHSAVLYHDKLYIFGGDRHKMAFNDMFELDLN